MSSAAATRLLFLLLTVPVLGARWLVYLVPSDAIILIGLAASAGFIALVAVKILLYVMGLIIGRAEAAIDAVEAVSVLVGLDILEHSTAHDLTGLETLAVDGLGLEVVEETFGVG